MMEPSNTAARPRPWQSRRPQGRRGLAGLSLVWAIPALALAIGAYLTLSTLAARGPEITVAFSAAGTLKPGTKVEHKSVELGAVTLVGLSADGSHVDVHIRMQSVAAPFLTTNAQFWVARLQLSGGTVSGIESLISGSYIEMDPGAPGGEPRTSFKGLDNPPGRRSDQPGTTFMLRATKVSGLASGTGVFFRDVQVGEVLSNAVPDGDAPVLAQIFIRRPFDERVRTGTVFWQTRGVRTEITARALHLELTSLSAAVSGGVSFGTPPNAPDYPRAAERTVFPLLADEDAAYRASDGKRVPFVTYFQAPAAGLAAGSKVLLQGIQVGEVTDVQLDGGGGGGQGRLRVALELLPRSAGLRGSQLDDLAALGRQLVLSGLQAKLDSASYVTGAQTVSLDFQPGSAPARQDEDAGLPVLPSAKPSAASGLSGLAGTAAKALQLPYAAIGNAANAAIQALTARLGAAGLGRQLAPLAATIENARGKVRQADGSLAHALGTLPPAADKSALALVRARNAVGSLNNSFGAGSGLSGEIDRALAKYYDLARYYRQVSDRLDQHPEAIVRGTTSLGTER